MDIKKISDIKYLDGKGAGKMENRDVILETEHKTETGDAIT